MAGFIFPFRKCFTRASEPPSSPIRKVPPELLVEIFTICWSPFTALPLPDDNTSFREELEHLAHAPLLNLAKVCSEWHAIILGTPSLWSDVRLVGALWSMPVKIPKVMQLLGTVLARSDRCPLTLVLSGTKSEPSHPPTLQLLAQSADRWKSLAIRFDEAMSGGLTSIQGNLSRLETLFIEFWELEPELSALDLFSSVPILEHLEFYGSPLGFSKFPLGQLVSLTCLTVISNQIPDIVALMPSLREGASCFLELFLSDDHADQIPHLHIPSSRSNIRNLGVEVDTEEPFQPMHFEELLGNMFASWTLPLLETLRVNVLRESRQAFQQTFHWPCQDFLLLSQRSSFHAHLRSLDIADVIITEKELLDCLLNLQTLERLFIADHDADLSGASIHLITDSLFTRLTRTPDSACLIPRLCSFTCRTMLQFTDASYYDFVCSRADDPPSTGSFRSILVSLYAQPRELDRGAVAAQLNELWAAGKLDLVFPWSEPL